MQTKDDIVHGSMIESVDAKGEKQALGTGGTSIVSFLKVPTYLPGLKSISDHLHAMSRQSA